MSTSLMVILIVTTAALTALLAWLASKVHYSKKISQLSSDLQVAKSKIVFGEEQIKSLQSSIDRQREEIARLQSEDRDNRESAHQAIMHLESEKSILQTSLREQETKFKDQIDLLVKAKDQMKQEFELLAQRIFDEKNKAFTELTKTNLGFILSPFREQMADFKKKVEEVYAKEGRERFSLTGQIEKLQEAYQRLSGDATNLANALKADTKTQGDWGEINLRRILQYTGLVDGVHFKAQESFKDEHGKQLRPDVVVYLPDNKQIIVDSKVSLTGYERYSSAATDGERKEAIKAHLLSVRNHIDELSLKRYEDIPEITTLDFVLMFIPVEPAYFVALQNDPDLFRKAAEKKVLIVCPTTLLVTLYLVNNLWHLEKQNQNVKEIASRGSLLLEKFNGFVNSLEGIKTNLDRATTACDDAMKKLQSGDGNLISQAQKLMGLGVKKPKRANKMLAASQEDEGIIDQDTGPGLIIGDLGDNLQIGQSSLTNDDQA